ncbi:MAG: hypothetical protein ACJ760_07595 [Thermoleophilaceae bacterium]
MARVNTGTPRSAHGKAAERRVAVRNMTERERQLAVRGMFWVVWIGVAIAVGTATGRGALGAGVGLVTAIGFVGVAQAWVSR